MKKVKLFNAILLSLSIAALASCNESEEITIPGNSLPEITLDSETGVYTVKVGRELVVDPQVKNNEGAEYFWELEGDIISRKQRLSYVFDHEDSIFITFRVETKAGTAEKELKVNVVATAPPVISLALPSDGFKALAGREYLFAPDVQNGEGAEFSWYLDGEPVSEDKDYTFMQQTAGDYELRITAVNEDGEDERTFAVSVMDGFPVSITFPKPMWNTDPLKKSVSLGRTLFLRPCVENAVDAEYSWAVNDVVQHGAGSDGRMFGFTPDAVGEYKVKFTVTDKAPGGPQGGGVSATDKRVTSVELTVTCYGEEETLMKNTTGQRHWNRVYEYLPAPGQFVNETKVGGFTGESTFAQAIDYAEKRLAANIADKNKNSYLSLGGFGGYIIVGFDHSVRNLGGYDFSAVRSKSDGSSEPGIVWVMQDTNGNGIPDDEWYELKGSEYGKPETAQEYAVSYYRPAGSGMDVQWSDNLGNTGRIDHLASFHPQAHYYPLWMEAVSYTLYGSRLQHRTTQKPNGEWINGDFDWGYADNMGSDTFAEGDDAAKTYFKISNAVNLDGSPAELKYIDFVKVQSGVNMKAGWLGELSTEVFGFEDENL